MAKCEIKPGVYWVGGIDWDIRNFHGYTTDRGTTYNAYLVVDEKVVLVDTVKHYLFDEMLGRIREIVDPSGIDLIVSNHTEMDHSGSLARMVELCPNATVVCSPNGEKNLRRHFKKDWNFKVVRTGDTIKTGRRTLVFQLLTMIHWPDSMATYIPEDRLLLPNDAFGQHIASAERFDDQLDWGVLREEAAKYWANIVLPYSEQVRAVLPAVAALSFDMIAPSHGIIWRSRIPDILGMYSRWAGNETDRRALIVYDTMWHSTGAMAHRLKRGLEDAGVPVVMRRLGITHLSDIVTDVLSARLVLVGSPTLNNGMLPTMGEFLTYIKGLRPKRRIGFAFGSYGWGGQAVGEMEAVLKELGWEMPLRGVNLKFVPDESELAACREAGRALGEHLMKQG
ncbi:MAG: FprA family A-type flavoprotein [Euryarchaeota archaeon]|nr:FprA family A-type flavoprotein [Euryarchaeota archaeon]